MKKISLSKILLILTIFIIILSFQTAYANADLEKMIQKVEYSEDYKKWLELSEEEKSKIIQPRMYEIQEQTSNRDYLKNMNNVFKTFQLLKATLLDKYSLQTEIPQNVKIKNQMSTNSCWAFATMGTLESYFGLRDKLESRPETIYDFSERHMVYGSSRNGFKYNQINEMGFAIEPKQGGSFLIANAYLTNGSGAVKESEMPFENNENAIDISEIKNKNVSTTLLDTVEFAITNSTPKQEVITKMKEHITNYGGISATVHGAKLLSDNYNNETGAIYCNNKELTPADHAVTIIGWDDNYSKENFNTKNQPTSNGAWIVKNSWGESQKESVSEIQKEIFEQAKNELNSVGIDSPEKISNDLIIKLLDAMGYGKDKIKIENNEVIIEVGNKGYMYVSYEDVNIYELLSGVEKASTSKDYDNIYQYDILGPSAQISLPMNETVYIANVFQRDINKKEKLDKISVYTGQEYTCKVYVNPNGSGKSVNELKQVQLANGDTETFGAGFHTIEFAEPIELTGNSFAVAIEILGTSTKLISLEAKNPNGYWSNVEVNPGESFFTTKTYIQNDEWQDLGISQGGSDTGNVCIKAYTKETRKSRREKYNKNRSSK